LSLLSHARAGKTKAKRESHGCVWMAPFRPDAAKHQERVNVERIGRFSIKIRAGIERK
jgi:hypothetical protein